MTKEALLVAGIALATLYGAQWLHGFVAAQGGIPALGITSGNWLSVLFALVALYCLLPT